MQYIQIEVYPILGSGTPCCNPGLTTMERTNHHSCVVVYM